MHECTFLLQATRLVVATGPYMARLAGKPYSGTLYVLSPSCYERKSFSAILRAVRDNLPFPYYIGTESILNGVIFRTNLPLNPGHSKVSPNCVSFVRILYAAKTLPVVKFSSSCRGRGLRSDMALSLSTIATKEQFHEGYTGVGAVEDSRDYF